MLRKLVKRLRTATLLGALLTPGVSQAEDISLSDLGKRTTAVRNLSKSIQGPGLVPIISAKPGRCLEFGVERREIRSLGNGIERYLVSRFPDFEEEIKGEIDLEGTALPFFTTGLCKKLVIGSIPGDFLVSANVDFVTGIFHPYEDDYDLSLQAGDMDFGDLNVKIKVNFDYYVALSLKGEYVFPFGLKKDRVRLSPFVGGSLGLSHAKARVYVWSKYEVGPMYAEDPYTMQVLYASYTGMQHRDRALIDLVGFGAKATGRIGFVLETQRAALQLYVGPVHEEQRVRVHEQWKGGSDIKAVRTLDYSNPFFTCLPDEDGEEHRVFTGVAGVSLRVDLPQVGQ